VASLLIAFNNFLVETAKSGEAAIKYCDSHKFDIITLDLLLPDISGLKVLRRIRSGLNKDTPTIVITVAPGKQKYLSFLISDYLVKPIEKKAFLLAIQRAGMTSQDNNKIVVIDDDPTSSKLLTQLLKGENYKIICVSDPTKGLETVLREKPDLVILDLLMPNMNGFEIISQLTKEEFEKEIPIIIWTSKDLTKVERDILYNSAQAIILKNAEDSRKKLLSEKIAKRSFKSSSLSSMISTVCIFFRLYH